MTYAIATVKKNLVNRTVSFENELVPLNDRIVQWTALEHQEPCIVEEDWKLTAVVSVYMHVT